MWCIKEVSDILDVEIEIALDTSQSGPGLPWGFNGQKRKGFSFFELTEHKRGRLR